MLEVAPFGRALLHPIGAVHGLGDAASPGDAPLGRQRPVVERGKRPARGSQDRLQPLGRLGRRVVDRHIPAVQQEPSRPAAADDAAADDGGLHAGAAWSAPAWRAPRRHPAPGRRAPRRCPPPWPPGRHWSPAAPWRATDCPQDPPGHCRRPGQRPPHRASDGAPERRPTRSNPQAPRGALPERSPNHRARPMVRPYKAGPRLGWPMCPRPQALWHTRDGRCQRPRSPA